MTSCCHVTIGAAANAQVLRRVFRDALRRTAARRNTGALLPVRPVMPPRPARGRVTNSIEESSYAEADGICGHFESRERLEVDQTDTDCRRIS